MHIIKIRRVYIQVEEFQLVRDHTLPIESQRVVLLYALMELLLPPQQNIVKALVLDQSSQMKLPGHVQQHAQTTILL